MDSTTRITNGTKFANRSRLSRDLLSGNQDISEIKFTLINKGPTIRNQAALFVSQSKIGSENQYFETRFGFKKNDRRSTFNHDFGIGLNTEVLPSIIKK